MPQAMLQDARYANDILTCVCLTRTISNTKLPHASDTPFPSHLQCVFPHHLLGIFSQQFQVSDQDHPQTLIQTLANNAPHCLKLFFGVHKHSSKDLRELEGQSCTPQI